MTLAKLDSTIKEIATNYFASMAQINRLRFSSGDIDIFSPFQKYYNDVEKAFSYLNQESKEIITKEYFYDGFPFWWVGTYKKREFKRKKSIAIKAFMEVFNEIH